MKLHGMEIDDLGVVDATWRHKVEGGLPWEFCAALLCMETGYEVAEDALAESFTRYFQERLGADPYGSCPQCAGHLSPARDAEGPYVACSDGCGFVAKPVRNGLLESVPSL